MSLDDPALWRPPWRKLPGECTAVVEYLRARWRPPESETWPRGDGLAIVVLPGFGLSAHSTAPLRAFLTRQGFAAHDWSLGRNLGQKSGMTHQLLELIQKLQAAQQRPVALVGWSLGGIIARELARKQPEAIERVISLGSPIAGPQSTTLQTVFDRLNPGSERPGHDPGRYLTPAVPCTAIFTRRDGIAAWQGTREPPGPRAENIEVSGSHLGLGYNPAVWYAICHRLSPGTRQQAFAWPESGL